MSFNSISHEQSTNRRRNGHEQVRDLRSGLLLLVLVQGKKRHTGNLAHLEAATGNITFRLTSLTETRDQDHLWGRSKRSSCRS